MLQIICEPAPTAPIKFGLMKRQLVEIRKINSFIYSQMLWICFILFNGKVRCRANIVWMNESHLNWWTSGARMSLDFGMKFRSGAIIDIFPSLNSNRFVTRERYAYSTINQKSKQSRKKDDEKEDKKQTYALANRCFGWVFCFVHWFTKWQIYLTVMRVCNRNEVEEEEKKDSVWLSNFFVKVF